MALPGSPIEIIERRIKIEIIERRIKSPAVLSEDNPHPHDEERL